MGVAQKKFEGMGTRIPGVYTKSLFPPSTTDSNVTADIVYVIGEAAGGNPFNGSGLIDEDKTMLFTDVGEIFNTLISGNLANMSEFYLTPSTDPNINKPSEVRTLNVSPGTRATGNLKATAANIIDLLAQPWGTIGNQIARKATAGTSYGKKVQVRFQGKTVVEQDNVGYQYFDIQYVGAATACALTINGTQLSTLTSSASVPADDLTLLFANFSSLGQLCSYIDDHPSYVCTLKTVADTASNTLDAVTSQSIMSVYTAGAIVQALIDFFTNQTLGLYTANLTAAAARTVPDNDTNFVFQTTGSRTAASTNDWAAAFDLLTKFSVDYIIPATGSSTIHAMAVAHNEAQSSIKGKRYRAGGAGAISGLSVAARQAEARVLNSSRFEYWGTPIKRYDLANNYAIRTFEPFFGAALGAGIRFANDVTISASQKTVNILGVGEQYTEPETDALIEAGVTLIAPDPEGFVIVHNVTTYRGVNLILNLPSLMRTVDFITKDSQFRIQQRMRNINRAATEFVVKDFKNWLSVVLLPSYVDQQILTPDSNTGKAAFSNPLFEVKGDAFEFSFEGIIAAPLHFGFVKQTFVVNGAAA